MTKPIKHVEKVVAVAANAAWYVYDTLNRMSTLTNSLTGQFGFGYDTLSRRTSLTRPNTVNTAYNYDSVSRLLSVLHQTGTTTLDGASYTYDNAANRTSKGNSLNGITEQYTYDPLYQLTQVTQGTTTTESYSYDAVGNRLSSLGMSTYSYNTSNQLTSTPAATFTYDNSGNTTSKTDSTGTRNYTWDFENRLTSVVLPGTGGTVTFKYDPFGRRIQKSSASGTTIYLYDGANSVEEVDQAGSVLARYAQGAGIDEPLAELRSESAAYYQQDGLASVTSLSNSTAALANTYTYNAFGNLTASTGTTANSFQYTGRDYDPETGLRYYRARYYDPIVGRFISEDPIGFAGGGPNFYAYVLNNPVRLRDPSGQSAGVLAIPAGIAACVLSGVCEAVVVCFASGVCETVIVVGSIVVGVIAAGALIYENWGSKRKAIPKPSPRGPKCEKTKDCAKQLDICIEACFGALKGGEWPFRKCVADCMDQAGCSYTVPRPFYNPPSR